MRQRLEDVLLLLVLSFSLAFLGTRLIQYSGNTPSSHPDWINSKLLLARPPMGALESLTTRNLLRQNALHLNEWHGFNEFLTGPFPRLGLLQFSMRLGANGLLSVLFNKTPAGTSGFRLSRNPAFPAMYFRTDADGRFVNKMPVTFPPLDARRYVVEVIFQNGDVVLRVDGAEAARIKEASPEHALLGFRSAAREAVVDDVMVFDQSSWRLLKEDFSRPGHFIRGLFLGFLALCLLNGWVFYGALNKASRVRILAAECIVILILSSGYAFDYYYWSGQYPYSGFLPGTHQTRLNASPIEQGRRSLFGSLLPVTSPESYHRAGAYARMKEFMQVPGMMPPQDWNLLQVMVSQGNQSRLDWVSDDRAAIELYKKEHIPEHAETVLYLGTSQCWGEGTTRGEDTLAFEAHRLLQKRGKNRSWVTINASIRGGDAPGLVARYTDRLFRFSPRLVVVDLSNNDSYKAPALFEQSLRSLAAFNREHGIRTLFVLEPAARDVPAERQQRLAEFHSLMSTEAGASGIRVVDLDAYLASKPFYDSGFLWWDYIHLTSYGHRLAAHFLAGPIDEETRRK